MKDSFNIKLSTEIPSIQIQDNNGTNKFAYSDMDKIETLNTYFSSISYLDDSNETLPTLYSLCSNSLCNITINEQEIIDIISILPVNKAVGPDLISHKMLKSTISTVAKPLTMLFNRSLSEKKTFPSFWKLAYVIPLFKGLYHDFDQT
jgi:hypothetical protein